MLDRDKFFNDHYDEISREIERRRGRWQLRARPEISFDDVKQIILLHIYKKIDMVDQTKPFVNWLSVIINHQIINLLRNLYLAHVKPCATCSANEGGEACRIYGEQCSKCPLYAKWESGKKASFNLKLPLPLEHHSQEVFNMSGEDSNLSESISALHSKMEELLTPIQFKIYKLLYIDGKNEIETAQEMGYRTIEKNRSPGYGAICKTQKIIVTLAKKIIKEGLI